MESAELEELIVRIQRFAFEYGDVSANKPITDAEKKEKLYLETLQELTTMADQAAAGKKFFMTAVPWSKPSSVSAMYTRDWYRAEVSAFLMQGGFMEVEQEPENKASKVKVAGREGVYNSVVKEVVSYHYLTWYNEEQDAYYMLTDRGDKHLSKEQFLKLAGEIISGGK